MLSKSFSLVSLDACKELVKHAYPIEMQVDFYTSLVAWMHDIDVLQKTIFRQQISFKSSVQDGLNWKVIMPDRNDSYYVIFGLVFFIIVTLITIIVVISETSNQDLDILKMFYK